MIEVCIHRIAFIIGAIAAEQFELCPYLTHRRRNPRVAPVEKRENIAEAFWEKMSINTMVAADSTVTMSRYEEHPWHNPFQWGSGTLRVSSGINASMIATGHAPQGMLMWGSAFSGVPVPLKDPFKPTFAQLANLTK